jgi:hypothetical protein
MKYIKKFKNCCELSKELEYALNNSLMETFRYGSEKFFETILEAKEKYRKGELHLTNENDIELLNTDIGEKAMYEGKEVWLDMPMLDEDLNEKKSNDKYNGVKTSNPKRDSSGGKAYKVYVAGCNEKTKTNPRGITLLRFGSGGLKAKLDDPEARKRYDSRHGCSKGKHNDKCKPGYWSCRLPRFASSIGLSYKGSAQWW